VPTHLRVPVAGESVQSCGQSFFTKARLRHARLFKTPLRPHDGALFGRDAGQSDVFSLHGRKSLGECKRLRLSPNTLAVLFFSFAATRNWPSYFFTCPVRAIAFDSFSCKNLGRTGQRSVFWREQGIYAPEIKLEAARIEPRAFYKCPRLKADLSTVLSKGMNAPAPSRSDPKNMKCRCCEFQMRLPCLFGGEAATIQPSRLS